MIDQVRRVTEYDAATSGKMRPLWVMLGGAALAAVSLVLLALTAYRTWVTQELSTDSAYWGVSFLFCFYVLGVFLFSYGFEVYDTARALRLTLIVAVASIVIIGLALFALALLSKAKDGLRVGNRASDGAGLLPVIGSYLEEYAETPARRAEAHPSPEERPFLITCQGCGERFTPAPPLAECPVCGRAALASG